MVATLFENIFFFPQTFFVSCLKFNIFPILSTCYILLVGKPVKNSDFVIFKIIFYLLLAGSWLLALGGSSRPVEFYRFSVSY